MSTIQKKETTLAAAAHYAIYLGIFWIFKYLFLMGAEYNDLYLYIYNLLNIGTPILFYALACVYRDKRLGGKISFGKIIAFAVFLFLFASFLEAVVITINIIIVNPSYLSNLEEQVYLFYEKLGMTDQFLNFLKYNFKIDTISFIVYQTISNVFLGLILSLLLGYFISFKKSTNNHNLQQ